MACSAGRYENLQQSVQNDFGWQPDLFNERARKKHAAGAPRRRLGYEDSSGAMDVQAKSGHPRPGYVRHSRKIRKSPAASSSIWRGDVERAPVLEEMITSQLGGTMWRQAVEAPGSGITLAIR
jgi:hypothetical protein